MDVNNADIEATPVCDLILKDKCQYSYMMDQGFDGSVQKTVSFP